MPPARMAIGSVLVLVMPGAAFTSRKCTLPVPSTIRVGAGDVTQSER